MTAAEEARQAYRLSVDAGAPLTAADLAERFERSPRWARQVRAEVDAERGSHNGTPLPAAAASTPAAATSQPEAARKPPRPPAPAERKPQRKPQPEVPAVLLHVRKAAVVLVSAATAVVSYFHLRDLAVTAGMGNLAGWYPLALDGLVIVSTCSLMVDRHMERRGEPVAWLGVWLGLAGSLLGNLAAVDPTLVDLRTVRWMLASAPPIALAIAGHLAFRTIGGKG